MNVRTFRAPTMREAVNQVKLALGSEAVILNTREIRGGHNPLVEISAALDIDTEVSPVSSKMTDADWAGPAPEMLTGIMTELSEMRRELTRLRAERAVATQATRQWDGLMGQLKDLARVMGLQAGTEGVHQALTTRLMAAGVDSSLAHGLVERVTRGIADKGQRTRAVAEELRDAFQPAPPVWERDKKVVAAFVGPTGVGKTTTLAKIAATASVEHGKKVAIVAADTYRIASVDQIRTYAELLGLPWSVATGARELGTALNRFEEYDMVLVDTAGRNPWSNETYDDIEALLGGFPVERHLCVSASANGGDLAQIVDRYQAGGVRSLVVTKADEARTIGGVLSTVWGTDLQIAHITTGQQVPGDIVCPDAEQMCQTVLG